LVFFLLNKDNANDGGNNDDDGDGEIHHPLFKIGNVLNSQCADEFNPQLLKKPLEA
jgi:hypothetical protein